MSNLMKGHKSMGHVASSFAKPRVAPRRGTPLPDEIRRDAEELFGEDFSDVRVIVSDAAPKIGAIAFTSGSEIHIAPGVYRPGTEATRALLGHELAHVVQQRRGRATNPHGYGVAVVRDQGLEAEADRMGRALQMMQQGKVEDVNKQFLVYVPGQVFKAGERVDDEGDRFLLMEKATASTKLRAEKLKANPSLVGRPLEVMHVVYDELDDLMIVMDGKKEAFKVESKIGEWETEVARALGTCVFYSDTTKHQKGLIELCAWMIANQIFADGNNRGAYLTMVVFSVLYDIPIPNASVVIGREKASFTLKAIRPQYEKMFMP